MSIELALADAANNCERDGANATITLRGGVEITGKLEQRGGGGDLGTVHIRHGDGWSTVLVSEIAAVSSHR
jgi:hypothetical protein